MTSVAKDTRLVTADSTGLLLFLLLLLLWFLPAVVVVFSCFFYSAVGDDGDDVAVYLTQSYNHRNVQVHEVCVSSPSECSVVWV